MFRKMRSTSVVITAVAALGAGGFGWLAASSQTASSFVPIAPERVADSRSGLGVGSALVSPVSQTLRITGAIPRPNGTTAIVVPNGASAVVLNVTAVSPDAAGFVSVRPAGAPGAPSTSSLNFDSGAVVPNAVTVALSAGGAIELTYDAYGVPGPKMDVLVDVAGYYVVSGTGSPGPAGPTASAAAVVVDPVGLTPFNTPVLALSGPARTGAKAPDTTGAITVAVSSRLIANADAGIQFRGNLSQARCFFQYRPTTGQGAWQRLDATPGGYFSDSYAWGASNDSLAAMQSVSMSGARDVPAGSYDFQVVCNGSRGGSPTDGPYFLSAQMTVIAVAL
jgi:hypothetical protein